MKTLNTQAKQRGFFGAGLALILTAIFSTSSAVIVKLENDAKQDKVAAQQQKETPQSQANTISERSVTASVDQ